jgi:HEXXH motif-containing protein
MEQQFLTSVASGFARSLAHLLVEARSDQLAPQSHGLTDLLARWSAGDACPDGGWDCSFGDAFAALQAQDATDPVPIAVRMALHLGSRGFVGTWQASLSQPAPLRWGACLLPAATRIAVDSNGQVANIHVGGERTTKTVVVGRDETGWSGSGVEQLPTLGRQHAVVLRRRDLMLRGFDELKHASVDDIGPSIMATLERAVAIIAEHAPAYLPWVERVIHEVFLIQPRVKQIQSGSIARYFGLVHVSASSNPVAIAELLVHEASHQYFHLLSLVGPFDDGSDTNMYYSPAVRMDRPIVRIGVAYHAFANILLFYDACLASGLDDGGYCAQCRKKLAPEVAELEAPLRGNAALSQVGRALCDPLIDRLRS